MREIGRWDVQTDELEEKSSRGTYTPRHGKRRGLSLVLQCETLCQQACKNLSLSQFLLSVKGHFKLTVVDRETQR